MPIRCLRVLVSAFAVLSISCATAPPAPAAATPPAEPTSAPTAVSSDDVDFNPADLFGTESAACERGERAACAMLARRIIEGASPGEIERYREVFEAGCAKESPDACAVHALLTPNEGGRDALLAALEPWCEAGSSVGCAIVAEAKMSSSTHGSPDAVVTAATSQCEKLGGSVCLSVAAAWTRGYGVEQNPAKATEFTERACETGSAYACFSRGMELAEADAPDAAQRARGFYQKACDSDLGPACYNLAHQLLAGVGGPADPERAVKLGERACQLGDATACDFLAEREASAFNDELPLEKRTQVASRWCRLGGADACANLGFLRGDVAEKSGRLEDLEPVLALLQKGCVRGSARGCNALHHVVKDAINGCEAGDAGQCLVAGFAYEGGAFVPQPNGRATPANPEKAKEAFQKACDGGRTTACSRVR